MSVGDYIKKYGQPPLQTFENGNRGFNLENKGLTSLEGLQQIDHLRDATQLNLRNNLFKQIPAQAFAGLPNLMLLELSYNKIKTIEAHAFADLSSLLSLWLYKNKLIKLPEGLFDTMNNCVIFFLASNKLRALPVTLFKNIPACQQLVLDDNYFPETKDEFEKKYLNQAFLDRSFVDYEPQLK